MVVGWLVAWWMLRQVSWSVGMLVGEVSLVVWLAGWRKLRDSGWSVGCLVGGLAGHIQARSEGGLHTSQPTNWHCKNEMLLSLGKSGTATTGHVRSAMTSLQNEGQKSTLTLNCTYLIGSAAVAGPVGDF